MKELDLRLCVLTESIPEMGRSHEDVTLAAIHGGATMIQFRDKKMDDSVFAETASHLLSLTRPAGVPLIVNDRVEIAIAVGADGVHVGRNDGDVLQIMRRLPAGMIFGVSATSYEEALLMDRVGADYLGVGPIFPTKSKSDATPPMGEQELLRVTGAVRTPVMCIGGINTQTLPRCIVAHVKGAAVISAVTHAAEMMAATADLLRLWKLGVTVL